MLLYDHLLDCYNYFWTLLLYLYILCYCIIIIIIVTFILLMPYIILFTNYWCLVYFSNSNYFYIMDSFTINSDVLCTQSLLRVHSTFFFIALCIAVYSCIIQLAYLCLRMKSSWIATSCSFHSKQPTADFNPLQQLASHNLLNTPSHNYPAQISLAHQRPTWNLEGSSFTGERDVSSQQAAKAMTHRDTSLTLPESGSSPG